MVVMAIIFFCRIYTHYAGMWIFIQAIGRGATVSKFDFKPYTVDLVYQMDLLSTGETVGMVLMGTLTNILLLSFMCLFAFLAIRLGFVSDVWYSCSIRLQFTKPNLKSRIVSKYIVPINIDVWFVDNVRSSCHNACRCLSWSFSNCSITANCRCLPFVCSFHFD